MMGRAGGDEERTVVSPSCVVLDFDGTFTDVEREAEPFVRAYVAAIADVLGRDVRESWDRAAAEIAQHPERYGWDYQGRIVAPADADPYIRSTTIAQRVFDEAGVLQNPETRELVAETLFHSAYRQTGTAFRPGARETVEAILASGVPTFVVTNARTDVVTRKLDELSPRGVEALQIVGNARKFALDEPASPDARFDAVPRQLQLPGLERPVFPRRGRYFDALAQIWERTGATPDTTLVCGDIYELDLTLPIELGMHVHLLSSPRTPRYELDAIAALGPRGSHGAEISTVLAWLAA